MFPIYMEKDREGYIIFISVIRKDSRVKEKEKEKTRMSRIASEKCEAER